MKKVYGLLANGSEEVESLAVVDLLKRAGIEVELVSIHDEKEVVTAHDIHIKCDSIISDVDFSDADLIFIPGGLPGTNYMKESEAVKEALLMQDKEDKRIAAICAGPSVLGEFGLLKDKKATVYPGFEEAIDNFVKDGVITDGNITTARGLGFSFDLGLELIELLISKEKREEIKEQIQYEK